ncbi:MAG: ATP-binding protein [Myxococcaceae bacterium]|nr:ATP-binding protein [Myxococcaceae bacterium]
MSASTVREFLSFRRTFALLILLVVLPSAGLSGFGVVAILNERAAVEKRLELTWTGKLDTLGGTVRTALQASTFRRVPAGLEVASADGALLSDTPFVVRKDQVETTDERLRAELQPLLPGLAALPDGPPTVFTLSGVHGTLLAATWRDGDVLHGARLSLPAVSALAERLGQELLAGAEGVRFTLQAAQHEGPDTLVNRLVSEVQARTGAAEARAAIAERPMPAPLQELRLSVVSSGEDPVALTATRNRAVYGTLLGLFYATLVVGVVLTGRSLYREAQLSRLKTDFVSLVSHELRTPLTSIRMFIETLALGRVSEPKQTQAVLAMLLQETERLSGLIERVLDWGRIESGRKQYRFVPTDVQEVMDATVAAFRAQRLNADAALALEVHEGLPRLKLDREALAGALLNLLQNAYKYSGADKRIALRARREGRSVAIDVEDNGVGIAHRHQRRIFERFYRVDNLLTRRTEGSGLGLSIARRIIEAHGGRISVLSQPGHGSVFTIHLPVPRGA